jgi:hypothetical protein
MKTKLFSLALLFTAVGLLLQDAQFTIHVQHTNINPAYAGSRGALSIFALHRTQWLV